MFLVILHPTHSSSQTEPSNALWLTSRAEYIAEFSLLKRKKKVITTAAHYFINPAQTKDNLALACKTMLPGPGISHRNSGKKKKTKQNNPNNSHGKSSINWRESWEKTQSSYQRIVLLIAELEPAAVLAAHFNCLVTHIENTLWFSTVKRLWPWQKQKIPFLALEFH